MGTSQQTNPWLEAARSIPTSAPPGTAPGHPAQEDAAPVVEAAEQRPVLVSAHGGSGTTAWSRILGAVDGGNVNQWASEHEAADVPVVLVLRASVEGITAAKIILATHGAERFAAALVVAAAPGKLPRRIMAELRILSGALATLHAPWVPGLLLKRAANAEPSDIPAKELNKLTTTLTQQGVPTQGDTK
jgi:hypothetical protein